MLRIFIKSFIFIFTTLQLSCDNNPSFDLSVSANGYIPPDISILPAQINTSILEGQVVQREFTISNNGTDDLEWFGQVIDGSREQWTFTNCGQIGRDGPSQAQCTNEYANDNLNGNANGPPDEVYLYRVGGTSQPTEIQNR